MFRTRSSNNHNHYHKKHRLNMNENWCEKYSRKNGAREKRRHEDWILKQCHIWKIWCQQKSNVQIPKWYFAVKWQPDAAEWLPIAQCTIHSIHLQWRDILITLSRPLHSNEFPYSCGPETTFEWKNIENKQHFINKVSDRQREVPHSG